jgi:hypothetical protein
VFLGILAPLGLVAACSVGIAAPAGEAPLLSGPGAISGVIVGAGSASTPVNPAVVQDQLQIVARTPEGVAVGKLHFGSAHKTAPGSYELPYTIDDLPVNVALTVAAEGRAPASPVPTGFFLTFELKKAKGDPSAANYSVTLRDERAHVDGCDFDFTWFEVPPLPLPAPTPS